MIFTKACPHCEVKVEIPEELRGQDVNCPSCEGSFRAEFKLPKSFYAPPKPKQGIKWGTVIAWMMVLIAAVVMAALILASGEIMQYATGEVFASLLGLLILIWIIAWMAKIRSTLIKIEENTRPK